MIKKIFGIEPHSGNATTNYQINIMIRVGIIGGAGYTAGELLRILFYHPEVTVSYVHSQSQTGQLVSNIHTDLVGEVFMAFTDEVSFEVDVIFLCMGHGRSNAFLKAFHPPEDIKIIDLSNEFRLKDSSKGFIYGLPELNKAVIQKANFVANPGCFATAIQLALLPLAKARLLDNPIHIHAITGSTGAGQKPMETTHFSWRNNNLSVYKPFKHQHLGEIRQSLESLDDNFEEEINFLPIRGAFTRGIFASIYTKSEISEEYLLKLYDSFYEDHPFVILSQQNPDLKQVVNTNKCVLFLEKHNDKLLIISAIDNLVKGASGQAVQNMNLMFGLEETIGLGLKAMAF